MSNSQLERDYWQARRQDRDLLNQARAHVATHYSPAARADRGEVIDGVFNHESGGIEPVFHGDMVEIGRRIYGY